MTRDLFGFAAPSRSKDAESLSLTEKAARIADGALAQVLARGLAGRTEREVQEELDSAMRALGADGVSFPTIVATGPNAAEPHHEPGDDEIVNGHAVVIDMGAELGGQRSDMTRTVLVGSPSAEVARMWSIAREAQIAGLSCVCAGAEARSVDAAVRAVFGREGVLGDYLHLTGHGVGRVIHEHPILGPTCGAFLQEGEVVTVEPGLYREGVGGVRIEDLVVVTATGFRTLTNSPKELSCPQSARTT